MMRLWCFPQFLLFLIIRAILKAKYERTFKGRKIYRFDKIKHPFFSGTALFHTLLPWDASPVTIAHEHGHHLQGNKWGLLYLPVIGIASLRNNLKARKCERTWFNYYILYPEAEADWLGGVRVENGVRVYP